MTPVHTVAWINLGESLASFMRKYSLQPHNIKIASIKGAQIDGNITSPRDLRVEVHVPSEPESLNFDEIKVVTKRLVGDAGVSFDAPIWHDGILFNVWWIEVN